MLSYLFGVIRFHGLKLIFKFRKFMLSRRPKAVDSVSSERRNSVSALGMNHHREHPVEYKTLDPATIPKFVNQLVKPPVYKRFIVYNKVKTNGQICLEEQHLYFVDLCEFDEQVLPDGMPMTKVWGYGGVVIDQESGRQVYIQSSPGPTFETIRGIAVLIKWQCQLTGGHLFAVDPTLHWANPNDMSMDPPRPWPPFPPGFTEAQIPVPVVTHLHGGEVSSLYDGHPDAWFTAGGKKGPAYVSSLYYYPNRQEPTTLWYHDHALGITRLNVYAGLAGFYLIREGDTCCREKFNLPEGPYEIPIVIQDRSFNEDGSLFFPTEGDNPEIHPYWVPEFFGDTIIVNGKVWPNLNVERRRYRIRLLNGSNARFYHLKLSNGMHFVQIGTDGGYLNEPVELSSLLLAPAERADLLIDFSDIRPGTRILLTNDANAPYPDGDAPNPDTVGQIMQFTVPNDSPPPVRPPKLPGRLNHIQRLRPDAPQRTLTLNEVPGPNGPVIILLNGQKWSAPLSERSAVGSTEEWIVANLTMDTHPIHLHLVQFQLLNRQDFNMEEYQLRWEELNGTPPLDHPTKVLPVQPYLTGPPIPPDPNERGWKDTVRMNPNQVTRILVRFAPQDVPVGAVSSGDNLYPFNPSVGPGYVWHCHIIDHEDNEMMRPYHVIS
jgi:FtsP/CotA-like multicopper oxidase with cupredoxin domain